MLNQFKTVLLSFLMASLLSSCAKTGADSCLVFNPVYISKEDALTDATARQILSNNESGHTVCDWQYSAAVASYESKLDPNH